MLKRLLYIIFVSAVAAGLAACSKKGASNSDKPSIAVSIAPLADLVESICGDDYEVVTLLDRGANPETFDPSMSTRAAAANSELYFMLDAFPFEKSVGGKREGIVNVYAGIEPLYGTHNHSHGHNEKCHHEADPHSWTSAKSMKIIARNIAEAMKVYDADNADKYNSRLVSLLTAIDSLDSSLAATLSDLPTRSFAIWHPSLGYFARDYGLKQIAVGEESKEISPVRLKETITNAVSDSVKVFFFQKEFDSRQAFSINDQLGARMVTIDPLARDWMGQLEMIANELAGK